MKSELEALIKEQTTELRLGSYQPPQEVDGFILTPVALNRVIDGTEGLELGDMVDTSGRWGGEDHRPMSRLSGGMRACPIHGNSNMRLQGKSLSPRCQSCNNEAKRRRWATDAGHREAKRLRQIAYRARKRAESASSGQ